MMTNQEIINIALQQSAFDCNCKPEYFLPDVTKLKLLPCEDECIENITRLKRPYLYLFSLVF